VLFWGAGKLSQHWNEGLKSIFGYFYPTDIGIIGAIFTYGIFGVILMSFQLFFSEKMLWVLYG
jgi:hypothetical protein